MLRSVLPRALAALTVLLCVAGTTVASADPTLYHEPYRPQFHFTPAQNWMNDPNGLIYYQGRYNLFFQYNPSGDEWGNISWGHAVSTDLVHWQELPVAIPQDDSEYIYSGSAVLDQDDTSGFGTPGHPAMVAIYTSQQKASGIEEQAIAYSTDGGTTWTKYAGNPVLDIGARNFRDPKVFWYAPAHQWRMVVALSDQHKVSLYGSPDLKRWTHLSDFGPAGATQGVWECPDLFPLPVDGNPHDTKWVLAVGTNPRGSSGGSGVQYFVGRFDGTTFTPDEPVTYTPPPGSALDGFDSGSYGDWTPTGTAFGTAPAAGTLPDQMPVSGYLGQGLASSYHGTDTSTGALTSPAFTINQPYLNFLVGGGNHPYSPTDTPDGTTPAGQVFESFDDGTYDGWTTTGTAFGSTPAAGTLPDQMPVSGYLGQGLASSYHGTDASTGTLTSPTFTIGSRYIDFLIGGGDHPWGQANPTSVNLVVDGQVVDTATGGDSEALDWTSWDVGRYQGQQATIQIVDDNTGGWGHVSADQFVFAPGPAGPWDTQESVNLLVDGHVVRSTTGADSETLDWASWDLRDLAGKQATIQVVDHDTGGWGHILADSFTLAGAPALSMEQRAHWVDYGEDFYASNTWNDAPDGRRITIAWMSSPDYAGSIPTSPWRSADTVPRQLSLRTVDGHVRLVQQPVTELTSLRTGPAFHTGRVRVAGSRSLGVSGDTLEIDARLTAGTAHRFGLTVRGGPGQDTEIGYDTTTGEVYVDRTKSGDVGFDPSFARVSSAPLPLDHGSVTVRILVDDSSVEVFAGQGQVALTDQIFPAATSGAVTVFAEQGSATVDDLAAWHLRSIWP